VKEQSIVSDLNLDMFLPIIPLRAVTVYGMDESTLGEPVRQVAAEFNVALEPDREPDKNHFIRSDQYSFILKGVPSISMKFAAPPGTPENTVLRDWMKNRYHAPSDDLQQPVDLEAAGKFINMVQSLLIRVANDPERPRWLTGSFFARFAR
jgi:Zn-dependent M28 family amino/carboxypeptidase